MNPELKAFCRVAETLNNLAIAYGKLGDKAKERDMHERVLAIKERAYGPDHLEVAATLYNLAIAHSGLENWAKARELLERVLPIWTRAYGTDHPLTEQCKVGLLIL